ncbi:hypothetical protein ABLN67_20020 [Mycobacterium tuberculosis]
MFSRFIYRREWSFRIYRETLSRFRAPLHPPGCLPRPMSWSPTGSPRPNCWPSCRRT